MSGNKRKILFIVNPISGGIPKKNFPKLVEKYLDHGLFDSEIIYWHGDMDAADIARKGINEGFEIITAVGGDGTINKIGGVVAGTEAVLAVIPMGSGNGLARHLGLPLRISTALHDLADMQPTAIDMGMLNGKPFFNVAGMGFDAHIGNLFDKAKRRGFFTYAGITIQELWRYRPANYRLMWPGGGLQTDAFFISVCNGSQWGNNARVARNASMNDGLLNIAVSLPFKAADAPRLAGKIFIGGLDKEQKFILTEKSNVRVIRDKAGPVHRDGEPDMEGEELEFTLKPKALKILVTDPDRI